MIIVFNIMPLPTTKPTVGSIQNKIAVIK